MGLRLGLRFSLVMVILALTLSGERVEAQSRAGEDINIAPKTQSHTQRSMHACTHARTHTHTHTQVVWLW